MVAVSSLGFILFISASLQNRPAENVIFLGLFTGLPFTVSTFANTTLPSVEPEPEYYLGDLITGTYCSRIFSDCDRKHCRLQSPNFPGVYPRNLTCYYAVRQHEIPAGKSDVSIFSHICTIPKCRLYFTVGK